MGLKLLLAPSVEPLTLAEAKAHCRVDVADDDALITSLIVAARQVAEHLTARALVTQQWRLTLDAFPDAAIDLPLPPLASVESVKYRDAAGVLQTLDAAAYTVHTSALVGQVAPAYGQTWPSARDQREAVVIDFTAGYGNAAAVPQAIKQWLLLSIGGWYSRRDALDLAQPFELPRGMWDLLLDPYRIVRFA